MRLSIATRIFLGFAAVVTVFGAASSFAIWRMHAIGADIRLVSEGYLPLTMVSAQLETIQKNKQRDTDRLLDERDPAAQRLLIKLARLYFPRIIREKLDHAEELLLQTRRLADPAEQAFLDEIGARIAALYLAYDEYDGSAEALFSAMEAAEGVEDRGKELRRLERRIDLQLKQLSTELERRIHERVQNAQGRERSSSLAIVGFSLGAIVLGISAAFISVRLLAPIRTLTQAAVRIGRGDYSAEVPTDAADEVGVLAREFNQMAASLRAREQELREKQEALLRAEKLATVGRMAAQIAHEIRNPLSSIGLNTELLAEEIESDPTSEARRLCQAIGKEVDRLAEITDQYLRYARLAEPELQEEKLRHLVDDLMAFVAPELQQAKIRVEVDVPEELTVQVDEKQMRQALLNLIRNSREAMEPGGTLRIHARRAGGEVELAVSDDGVGMDAEEVERFFEPFFTTKKGGTGLGLSLTHQIVTQHGGSLRCESAPSEGTTFTIVLPGDRS